MFVSDKDGDTTRWLDHVVRVSQTKNYEIVNDLKIRGKEIVTAILYEKGYKYSGSSHYDDGSDY